MHLARHWRAWTATVTMAVLFAVWPAAARAQYFGQNKVQYRTFKFQVLTTAHFDLYHYPEEAEAAEIASRLAERWYARLSRFFAHELRGRQTIVLYAAPSHFQQTNIVEGLIGEGTGGVTESLRRRIVLPMAGSLADTDHVLGHELVHAFQFDITGADPRDVSAGGPGILEFPLWFVEGMAEYVSLGPVDAQTAMWMRDAALHEKLPQIKDLDDPKYFPYRWGHAFWAFIGAKYGDRAVASLVRSAANPRSDLAGLARQLGTTPDQLTADWHAAIHDAAITVLSNDSPLESQPRPIISHESGSGRYNVGPQVSPNGRQIAFFSEKNRFAIELFLADADTGHVERRLLQATTDAHFDSLEFLDSAGAWSPDGRTLALTAIRGGKPVLALIDPSNGHIRNEVKLTGLDDAINPAFAPDGQSVVLSGNVGGLSDLFLVHIASGVIDRLTHDPYADLQPVVTPDGKSVIFVTERFSTDMATLQSGPLRLARVDLATREVTPIAGFLRGKHLCPQVSADGRTLTFIADPDGVSNLYRMSIDGGPVTQVLSVATGVAGITNTSPALSASASGRLIFSVFEDDGHVIYSLDAAKIVGLVSPQPTEAGAVLPGRTVPSGDINTLLRDFGRGLPASNQAGAAVPAPRKLRLDGLGQPTFGTQVSPYGARFVGGFSASFSDMLGDRLVGFDMQGGGKWSDFGGGISYINRRHRWYWGFIGQQYTYRNDFVGRVLACDTCNQTIRQDIFRQYGPGAFAIAGYPLSRATRIEFGTGIQKLWFSHQTVIDDFTPIDVPLTLLNHSDVTVPAATPLFLVENMTAFVYDTTFFGPTSPIYGQRLRLQVSRTDGTAGFTTYLADWRRYFMPKAPVSFGIRVLHSGRYGTGAEDSHLLNNFLGYPEVVRGYGFGSVYANECLGNADNCAALNNLLGSRILVANFEVRAPLVGLFHGDLRYGPVPIEIGAFMDAGTAWTIDTRPTFLGGSRPVVRSAGPFARINVFGFLILEVAVAKPFDRPDRSWQWQVGVRAGF